MTIAAPTDERATYAGTRVVHDADAHLFETDGFYEAYADPGVRSRLAALDTGSGGHDLPGSPRRHPGAQPRHGRLLLDRRPPAAGVLGAVRVAGPGGAPRPGGHRARRRGVD